VAPESFPQGIAKFIDDGSYMKNEIFNVIEMGLFWKKILSGPFVTKEENHTRLQVS
jgi:hypothetical protein